MSLIDQQAPLVRGFFSALEDRGGAQAYAVVLLDARDEIARRLTGNPAPGKTIRMIAVPLKETAKLLSHIGCSIDDEHACSQLVTGGLPPDGRAWVVSIADGAGIVHALPLDGEVLMDPPDHVEVGVSDGVVEVRPPASHDWRDRGAWRGQSKKANKRRRAARRSADLIPVIQDLATRRWLGGERVHGVVVVAIEASDPVASFLLRETRAPSSSADHPLTLVLRTDLVPRFLSDTTPHDMPSCPPLGVPLPPHEVWGLLREHGAWRVVRVAWRAPDPANDLSPKEEAALVARMEARHGARLRGDLGSAILRGEDPSTLVSVLVEVDDPVGALLRQRFPKTEHDGALGVVASR